MLLLRTAAIRRLEARHIPTAQPPLMDQAGLAAADFAGEIVDEENARILVLAGPGNNGGDAFVCAEHLKARGHTVTLCSTAPTQPLPTEAAVARQAWLDAGGKILATLPDTLDFALIIDGLFGVGLSRPIEGLAADWIVRVNHARCPVLALDIPSGLDADSGTAMEPCLRATHTLTLLAAKPGLYMQDGRDHAGLVRYAGLGIDPSEESLSQPGDAGRLISSADFESALQPRRHNSHKGSYGSAAIVGSAPGMVGAALLAGRAALHLGAGRVYLGMLEKIAVDYGQPELMLREVADSIASANAVGIGPGLGQSEGALTALKLAIGADKPLAIDADALNLIAAHPVLASHLNRRNAPTLLTPHPTEAARLLGCETADVQRDRIGNAQKLAEKFKAAIVLKGSGSVVALPDGHWYVNGSGNGGLATAGTGDVLLGFVTALLAQGNDAATALLAAVHLHGAAADLLVHSGAGPVGLTAGELIEPARHIWNSWISAQQP
ncbi:MAG: NAD(P)H-hydrate dehydratase [Rhodocyclaceae bacterium]|nr:NAD(P)H-hydrate dehydratase [Rhodocyclaceae bacterium]